MWGGGVTNVHQHSREPKGETVDDKLMNIYNDDKQN